MAVRLSLRIFLFVGAVAGVAGLVAAAWLFRPNLTSAERGRRLAEANGCFACHGPEGSKGVANAGRTDGDVPSYGSLMMYASNPEEVREWIANGVTKAKLKSETWKKERNQGTLRMPAFGHRLSSREIDDLVAFVMAAAGEPTSQDSVVAAGRDRAEALGCMGCHGSGGRYARRNPGSLKGYVPPWDGVDFPELVSSEAEFREWVERGSSRRFEENPIANFFLDRGTLHMPAFRGKLAPGDLEALWAYIQWLRSPVKPGGGPRS